MKVKLLRNIPVAKEHGLTEGKVLDVAVDDKTGLWVKGDTGEKVKLWSEEYEEVNK